ncbi:potassium transporter Kup [Rhodobacter sp. KR11]|uniref:potassium transporter Kup n=1 Tax=Rhodobacter sp. KR11 TaxID=2974588 RepID=UPI0022233319|nr:potassium transporter Kup [Rhodobacter sp. KR11]MCW1919316.1 potassium transporter Kup [Rhodobacter sp. KR11]
MNEKNPQDATVASAENSPADSENNTAKAEGHTASGHGKQANLAKLILGSIGVVYGDIGTSPLYALRESLHWAKWDGKTASDVYGIVSLLLWTLVLIVTVKYVLLIMRADNRGEGGTLSLVALVQQALARRPAWLIGVGVVGISLFFGDAMITPAMSVLSAVEGMTYVAPGFKPFIVPVTLGIIIALFLFQSQGTERVSIFFGPIMVLWFGSMAVMGLMHIGDNTEILNALNPIHAVEFLTAHGLASFFVMGSVFLVVTGGEALYADMGHFGRKPIRLAWTGLVFPALSLSYLGQGAFVLAHPEAARDPFFLMVPEFLLFPMVILATAAAVIASQAVISGAFSMMQQAVQMGLLPRLEIRHTSETQHGQIYMPRVNMILMVSVIILVVAFESSTRLASAYGIAVTGDMVITTILAFVLFRKAWKWPLVLCLAVILPILGVELLFLGANLIKIVDGGYVPVILAATMCLVIFTWMRGTAHVKHKAADSAISLTKLIAMLDKSQPMAVPGTAVFLTQDPDTAPSALLHNLKHNRVLHSQNFIVTVTVANTPTVSDEKRIVMERLSDRFVRIVMTFGYMETPNVPKALSLARKRGEKFDIMTTSFFLNRRTFRSAKHHGLPFWQERLFIGLSKSAADATAFYCLPSNRVVEMGQQMAI